MASFWNGIYGKCFNSNPPKNLMEKKDWKVLILRAFQSKCQGLRKRLHQILFHFLFLYMVNLTTTYTAFLYLPFQGGFCEIEDPVAFPDPVELWYVSVDIVIQEVRDGDAPLRFWRLRFQEQPLALYGCKILIDVHPLGGEDVRRGERKQLPGPHPGIEQHVESQLYGRFLDGAGEGLCIIFLFKRQSQEIAKACWKRTYVAVC